MTGRLKDYKLKPMKTEAIGKLDPLDIFRSIRKAGLAFLSGTDGETSNRRYSYIGAAPFKVISAKGGRVFIDGKEEHGAYDPFEVLSCELATYKTKPGPFPFSGGALGYFSYDLKTPARDATGAVPDMIIGFYDPIIVYDHVTGESVIVSRELGGSAERAHMLREMILSKEVAGEEGTLPPASGAVRTNITREEYIEKVEQAKEYITEGDIYQINISQSYEIPWTGDPFALFCAVTKAAPAPHSTFLDLDTFQIISNSPERLLKVSEGIALTEPIKGTRPRGANNKEDQRLIEELRTSRKERAEHVMIVDLERNDLGTISKAGTVKVADFESVITLPGLHHMVSTVSGEIKDALDAAICLREIFPGGSITGAPKIRAMEIIEELEGRPRGIYTGGLGWLDFSGEADISMMIRTAVVKNATIHLSVGSGIVADSDPEAEYIETLLKAQAFLNILGERNE